MQAALNLVLLIPEMAKMHVNTTSKSINGDGSPEQGKGSRCSV